MVDWGVWVTVFAASVSVIGAGIFAILNRKGGERARKVPSWVELDDSNRELRAEMALFRDEISELQREVRELKHAQVARDLAISNVLHDIARQWPRDAAAPAFDREDLEVLGDTVPRTWRWSPDITPSKPYGL